MAYNEVKEIKYGSEVGAESKLKEILIAETEMPTIF